MQDKTQTSVSVSRRGFLQFVMVNLGLSAAAPLLSSCANDRTEEYQVNIVIQQSDIHYSPAALTVPRGATVTWLNTSYYSQSVTCDPQQAGDFNTVNLPVGAQAWSSGLLYPGQRYSKTFDTPGTYIYFGLPRLSPDTVGTIIVRES
jgi:plastocyanin